MKKIFMGCLQIMVLCIFTYILGEVSEWLHLNIPGSILGLVILFILLQTKVVKLKWIEVGGNWLVAELLLFFVPSAVGIIQYKHLLMDNGLKIIAVIVISSAIVMICSGLLAEKMAKQKEGKLKNADPTVLNSHR
ncbi:CidA/LrgA family protein [Heyndrickxia oleronia]|jgi:holin-like protein|uniref:CidA/LrgA family protein n=1 Tax=Heyndrickxia oleronia TaxID=38875 RepID=UPI002430E5AE|nr:CidA/LrgA family holin-like protein [Heyndrickxia oleronia]MCI1593654.1 CidA/LrgA family holin-like protein [Heyndrickxia oleronia]MCI1616014.1 CidA/LrgA family holin-like protein [Heyndrickxia oleronia]MCI1746603.1 CidA/LrgA family holin-like protein [Heyndrickxia oleronia]MCI1764401.1 CidA/LrgA family holin-like protein [Heyndrickxia oleronia]